MILTLYLELAYSVYIEIFRVQKKILQLIFIVHAGHSISGRKKRRKKKKLLAISIHPPYELWITHPDPEKKCDAIHF